MYILFNNITGQISYNNIDILSNNIYNKTGGISPPINQRFNYEAEKEEKNERFTSRLV